MNTCVKELRLKEVIALDGTRLGYVEDVEWNVDTGRVAALVIPGRLRLLGLLGREPPVRIPWEGIARMGEDIILVDFFGKGLASGGKTGYPEENQP